MKSKGVIVDGTDKKKGSPCKTICISYLAFPKSVQQVKRNRCSSEILLQSVRRNDTFPINSLLLVARKLRGEKKK
jgi:hypothetical protein